MDRAQALRGRNEVEVGQLPANRNEAVEVEEPKAGAAPAVVAEVKGVGEAPAAKRPVSKPPTSSTESMTT